MKQLDYFLRLAAIFSLSDQLEVVWINKCEMDGTMIKAIIAALETAIHTMKKISFQGTNWNREDAVEELVRFIATAPKLEYCSICD